MRLDRISLFTGVAAGALTVTLATSLGLGASPTVAQQLPIEERVAALEKEAHELEGLATTAQLIAAIYHLDSAGFHNLDDKLAAGEMVRGALGSVRRSRIVTQATRWPHDLEASTSELVEHMLHLEAALRDEDVPKSAPHARAVHELEHALSDKVYALLSGAKPAEHQDEKPH